MTYTPFECLLDPTRVITMHYSFNQDVVVTFVYSFLVALFILWAIYQINIYVSNIRPTIGSVLASGRELPPVSLPPYPDYNK